MTGITRSWLDYGIAVAGVALATVARMTLDPVLGGLLPFVTYYVAILGIVALTRLGPSLLAVVLGAVAADYFFVSPRGLALTIALHHEVSLILYLVVGIMISLLGEVQRGARRRAETNERVATDQRERLRVLLSSIGDAVIASDVAGRITFLNPVAEILTGWTEQEAIGQPLETVYRIVHQETREPHESPVARVLRDGKTCGLDHSTILIGKDGADRPIDDSASPIRDEHGHIEGVVLIFRDFTEQRRAEQTRTQLAFIVESSNDAIIGKTLDGVITSWNHGAERIYGYTAEEVLGRSISVVIPPDRPGDEPSGLEGELLGGGVGYAEVVRRRKDGREIAISLTVSPVRDFSGRIIGTSTIARDITDQKQAEKELKAALDAAETANLAKDQFLAMLSHELRTPLAPVLVAATAALQDPALPHDLFATFEMIRQNVELEARLIDDLLDVMRVIRGKMDYRWEVVDCHALVQQTFGICRSDWQAKQIVMAVDLGAVRHHVKADPARLQQVLWNLVKNAVKFTPEGGSVTIRSRNEDGRIIVEVTDTGIGIEPADLDRIFRAFEQVEDPRMHKLGGLGLGLAISRSIAEATGGTLIATSPGRDRGTTITLGLPVVDPVPAGARTDAPSTGNGKEHRPFKIMLVEDDAMTSRIMAKLLRDIGHTITTATTMAGALAAASPDLDLVVSDIGLPDGSGLDLMRRLRDEHGLRGIALTGFGSDEDIEKGRNAGFVAHLTKPIDFAKLDETIQYYGPVKKGSGAALDRYGS